MALIARAIAITAHVHATTRGRGINGIPGQTRLRATGAPVKRADLPQGFSFGADAVQKPVHALSSPNSAKPLSRRACACRARSRDGEFNHAYEGFRFLIETTDADDEDDLACLFPLAVLRKAFDMFDRDKKGFVHTNMVSAILRTLGQTFEDKDLKDLIAEIDQDGSGELEFDEFVALAARFLVEEDSEAMQEELREAFRLYDKEGNGYINVSDLREILRALDDALTEDELDEMIAEIDTDGSGTVDFDEFMEMMTGD